MCSALADRDRLVLYLYARALGVRRRQTGRTGGGGRAAGEQGPDGGEEVARQRHVGALLAASVPRPRSCPPPIRIPDPVMSSPSSRCSLAARSQSVPTSRRGFRSFRFVVQVDVLCWAAPMAPSTLKLKGIQGFFFHMQKSLKIISPSISAIHNTTYV